VLVVLLVVSIMTGMVIANFPSISANTDYEHEAERLRYVFKLARDEAELQATEYGFRADREGYQFLVYDDLALTWSVLDESPFDERELSDMRLDLKVEGEAFQLVDAGTSDDSGPTRKSAAPQVLLLSSGETTAFNVTLSSADRAWERTLVADGFATIEFEDEIERARQRRDDDGRDRRR